MNKFNIKKIDIINKKMHKYDVKIAKYSKILRKYDGTLLAVNEIENILKKY